MGVNDLGGYDVQKYSHNVPHQTERQLMDVIGTDKMSQENGCSWAESDNDEDDMGKDYSA